MVDDVRRGWFPGEDANCLSVVVLWTTTLLRYGASVEESIGIF